MKRRTRAGEEWVHLTGSQNKGGGNPRSHSKNRVSKVNRRVAVIGIGLTFLLAMSLLKRGSKSTSNLLANGKKKRNRKVVLLGPHDRYHDFGDILVERVISKLLVDRAGYIYNEDDDRNNTLLLAGVVTRSDMDQHGLTPHKTVYSMKAVQTMSREDTVQGPYDLVFTGGSGEGPGDEGPSVLYEKYKDAVEILETQELRDSALADRVYDCPYLFPKELMITPINETEATIVKKHLRGKRMILPKHKKNYAIVDSLETPPSSDKEKAATRSHCRRVAAKADHFAFRNSSPLAPDSLVMTKELFGAEIKEMFESQVRKELLDFPQFSTQASKNSPIKYIAVQHESVKDIFDAVEAQDLAEALDEVSRNLGNSPVVFFPAGMVDRPLGDGLSFQMSRKVAEKMKQPYVLYETNHAFKVAALIYGAEAVISTNLHVWILSFVYQKPRVTWQGGKNHENFLKVWEASDVASMGRVLRVRDTWKEGLQRYFVNGKGKDKALITQSQTEAASQRAAHLYQENFNKWSHKLVTPTGSDYD